MKWIGVRDETDYEYGVKKVSNYEAVENRDTETGRGKIEVKGSPADSRLPDNAFLGSPKVRARETFLGRQQGVTHTETFRRFT